MKVQWKNFNFKSQHPKLKHKINLKIKAYIHLLLYNIIQMIIDKKKVIFILFNFNIL